MRAPPGGTSRARPWGNLAGSPLGEPRGLAPGGTSRARPWGNLAGSPLGEPPGLAPRRGAGAPPPPPPPPPRPPPHTHGTDGRQHCEGLPQVAIETGAADLVLQDGIGGAQDREPFGGDGADDANRESGAREGLSPHHPLRHAELLADTPHLVLEQQA